MLNDETIIIWSPLTVFLHFCIFSISPIMFCLKFSYLTDKRQAEDWGGGGPQNLPHFWFSQHPAFMALSQVANTWKQPKCPSTNEWIKKWGIYTQGISPTHKKKEILPLVTDKMDESGGLYAKGKQAQTEKDKTILYKNLKKNSNKTKRFYRDKGM